MGTDTRQRMVDTAVRLFRSQGYAATSWRGLVQEAGTPWGSVQHHFPGGKAELAVAALGAGEDVVAQAITIGFDRYDDPADAVAWWFGKAGRLLERSGFREGCPVAMLALEGGGPQVAGASRKAFERWQGVLADRLREKGLADPEGLALSTLIALEGALVMAKALQSTHPLDRAAADVRLRLAS